MFYYLIVEILIDEKTQLNFFQALACLFNRIKQVAKLEPIIKNLEMAFEKIELWGGIECTINRVKNNYFDQLDFAGFYDRDDDIDRIIDLNIKALRYPVLWEKHQPKITSKINWEIADRDLNKLRSKNIKPIIGLVHHGSGPKFVNFFDGSFENGLAKYAAEIAKKFPWIEYYTPVNEPLTTARFCGLYGHWYPHKKDDYSFSKIVISECKATVLAMQAIRKINPNAKLIQTEDLGKIHGTATMQYQADFENDRRWLAMDLLCGSITPDHPMWEYLIDAGIDESDLFFFLQNNCTPDILGLNYYITSERFLDERLECYPRHTHGKNFHHEYADLEAIRVGEPGYEGAYALILETSQRFKLPIAITEVHLHCHRDEQLRWFNEMWQTAKKLRAENVNIKAVTSWALLGSFGWNNLLKTANGDYEPGAFDIRSGKLRPLALAAMLKEIANDKTYDHPVLQQKGWWQRNTRILYSCNFIPSDNKKETNVNHQPLLIFGKTGTLGKAFAKVCDHRNITYKVLGRAEADICNPEMIEKIIGELKPWAVINATGYVRVDDAENDIENCFAINSKGVANIAQCCKKYNVQLVTFSSDLVFNGEKNAPYVESDNLFPLNIYGQSKAQSENILNIFPEALLIRTSAFFGPWDEYNFINLLIKSLKENKPFYTLKDVTISPTYLPDLCNLTLDLLLDKEKGIWHIANNEGLTWTQLAYKIANRLRLNKELIIPQSLLEMQLIAKRPLYSVLESEKGIKLPAIDDALERYFYETDLFEKIKSNDLAEILNQ